MPLTQRIELRVDDAFVDALKELADRLHKSRADVIRDALNYYSNAVDDWDKNNTTTLNQKENKTKASKKAEPCMA